MDEHIEIKVYKFPAPLEVDRYLYHMGKLTFKFLRTQFPAPREVDRYLYRTKRRYILVVSVSAPSRDR